MPELFNFCPEANVPETLPPEDGSGFTTTTGWTFVSRPTAPYQRRFKVKLYGLRWFLDRETGLYHPVDTPTINARALELFYERHRTWKPFNWIHQHLSDRPMLVRFNAPVQVPAGLVASGGQLDPLEVTFIEHNPGY